MTSKRVYFNTPQRLTQLIGANTTVIVAGRRTGKTDSIASPFVLRNMQRMPGSTGGIVVPTFKHGLTNTIPGLLAAWRRWGLLPNIHYVVGKKPPKSFGTAIIEPTDFEHVISFYNGSRAIIISQDRPGSSNSLTLSWLLIDEAKFIDYEKLKEETRKKIRHLDKQLNQMRSVAVYYKEYSSIENLQLLGENYIKQMKRDLTPLTFQTSILCKQIGIAKDGFYSSMRESHKYDASNFEYLDTLWQSNVVGQIGDIPTSVFTSQADRDVNPDAPICIGMDYNANINWIVAGQHRNKTVVFYYDTTALGSNYAVNTQDFRWVVIHEFERHGWQVQDVYLGNPMRHDEKYLLINQAFQGKQRLMPFFNRQNNDDLILAIQSAGVLNGRNGFHKNKSGEKLAESEEDLLEHRTDGTDAFDTLYIGCEKFPQEVISSVNYSGIG